MFNNNSISPISKVNILNIQYNFFQKKDTMFVKVYKQENNFE